MNNLEQWRRVGLIALLIGLLGGCPRDAQDPDADRTAECDRANDCNEGRTCGNLRLCVDGLCEAEPSLTIACRKDAG